MVDIKEVITSNIRKQLDEVDKTEKDLARYQVIRESLPVFLEACIIIMHICRVFHSVSRLGKNRRNMVPWLLVAGCA